MCINSNEMEHTTMTLTFTRKSGTHFKVASVKYGPSVNKVKNVDMLNHHLYNWERVNCPDWHRLASVNVLHRTS